ncbi:alpha/beta fold hydrolase [Micromonospora sp. NPDC007271]|uniref:thioesterase II family protein n=1 Tax=Micromonospora sp. NPDC007271 TaxID=3154587 RepID=UPI0033FAF865
MNRVPPGADWLVTWRPRPAAAMRLVCLPPAGGGAGQFRTWSRLAPPTVEVVAVELPGRGLRRAEPVSTDMAPVTGALADAVAPLLDRPLCIVGHSMGALIGWDLAHELRDRALPAPVALVTAACRAPTLFFGRTRRPEPTEDELVTALRAQGGVPAGVLESDRYRAMFLATLRGDVALIERYEPPARPPLTCNVYAYVGTDDDQTGPADVGPWQAETTGRVRIRVFPGGHHFLAEHAGAVLSAVLDDVC